MKCNIFHIFSAVIKHLTYLPTKDIHHFKTRKRGGLISWVIISFCFGYTASLWGYGTGYAEHNEEVQLSNLAVHFKLLL